MAAKRTKPKTAAPPRKRASRVQDGPPLLVKRFSIPAGTLTEEQPRLGVTITVTQPQDNGVNITGLDTHDYARG